MLDGRNPTRAGKGRPRPAGNDNDNDNDNDAWLVVIHLQPDEVDDAVLHLRGINGRLTKHKPADDEYSNARRCLLDRKVVEPLGDLFLDTEQVEPDEVIGRRLTVGAALRAEGPVDVIEELIVDSDLSTHRTT
ncbi:MAG: hypothetical protein AAGD35_11300 [Actinomycetota bacterium]